MCNLFDETTVYPDSLIFKEKGGILNNTITLTEKEFNKILSDFEESQKDYPKE